MRKPSPDNPPGLYTVEDRGYDTPCWICTSIDLQGYGRMSHLGTQRRAHRVMYMRLVGPIPEGLVLDHLCRVRSCVNPEHLEPVTNEENLKRGFGWGALNAAKTHCAKGHPFSGENLYVKPNGERACRACRAASRRRYRDRQEQA